MTTMDFVREQMAIYDATMKEALDRLTHTDTRVKSMGDTIDHHTEQIRLLSQDIPTIRRSITAAKNSVVEDTQLRIMTAETNMVTTIQKQRNASETLVNSVSLKIDEVVDHFSQEMANLRLETTQTFDDTELRVELRQLVESQAEELTTDLGRVLSDHSVRMSTTVADLSTKVRAIDAKLTSFMAAGRQQPRAQIPDPTGPRARLRRNLSNNLWDELSDEETNPIRRNRSRQPSSQDRGAAAPDEAPPSYYSATAANGR